MNVIQPLLHYCKYELIQEGTLSNEEISNICDIPLSVHDSSNRDGGGDEFDTRCKGRESSAMRIALASFSSAVRTFFDPLKRSTSKRHALNAVDAMSECSFFK